MKILNDLCTITYTRRNGEKVGLQDSASWDVDGFALILVFATNMLGVLGI